MAWLEVTECPWKEWVKEHPDQPCWGAVRHVDDLEWADGEWAELYACEGHANFHSHRDSSYIPEKKDESETARS